MGNQFVKGWTNNHLTWVMVDATDFATPESALSAATKIKIYGKVKGATGANFVSSGTGSLTNDIQHVGASALGIYTIALAKADLSDASAAWYDQYIIALSATGAAYQTLIVDGGIWISDLSAIASDIRSDVSDMHSDLIVMSGILSDAYSAIVVTQSAASDAYSAALIIQSRLSDFDSRMVSDVSDIRSMLTHLSDAVSDFRSHVDSLVGTTGVQLNASSLSDLRSAIAAGPAATVTASDISDIASAVRAILVSDLSDILSATQQTNSRVLVVQSLVSDVDSALTSRFSDIQSLITTTGVQLNASTMSDLRSAITAVTATISASDMSDIASRVWSAKYNANSVASSFGSLFEKMASSVSDLDSRISTTPSTKSQVASATFALFASHISDVTSAFAALSDAVSDLKSVVTVTGVQLNASSLSDIRSAISAGPAATVTASDISDIASAVWAHTIGARVDSRILVAQSTLSDIRSDVSDMHSDLLVMSGILSDTYSAVLLAQSLASDAHSAAVVAQSISASDMSDIRSAVTVAATLTASDISDIASAVKASIASELSDIQSAATAIKAKTDGLTFTVANQVDANIQYVNDVAVTGNGQAGTEWGP